MSHPAPYVHITKKYRLEMSVPMVRGGSVLLLAVGDNEGDCSFYWIPKKKGGKLYLVNDNLIVDHDKSAEEFYAYVAQQEWEADESAWEDHCERLGDIQRERAAGIE
jgi:hypothetical protein